MKNVEYRVWDNEMRQYRTNPEGLLKAFFTQQPFVPNRQFAIMTFDSERYVVEISVGRTALDGSEIYSGDIIEIAGHTSPTPIVFERGVFGFKARHRRTYAYESSPRIIERMYPLLESHRILRVLGNIHENPELLKKGA